MKIDEQHVWRVTCRYVGARKLWWNFGFCQTLFVFLVTHIKEGKHFWWSFYFSSASVQYIPLCLAYFNECFETKIVLNGDVITSHWSLRESGSIQDLIHCDQSFVLCILHTQHSACCANTLLFTPQFPLSCAFNTYCKWASLWFWNCSMQFWGLFLLLLVIRDGLLLSDLWEWEENQTHCCFLLLPLKWCQWMCCCQSQLKNFRLVNFSPFSPLI